MAFSPDGFNVDTRRLEYFAVVAEERHFGRAAQRLGISQAWLSDQIRQLETAMDVVLLIRDSRNVRTFANQTADAIHRVRTAAPRLGCPDYAVRTVMADVISSVHSLRPGFTVHVTNMEHTTAESALRTGLLDAYLTVYMADPRRSDLEWLPLFDDELLVMMAASDPFAKRSSVDLFDLLARPLSGGPAFVGQFRAELEAVCRAVGRPLTLAYLAPTFTANYLYVATGRGLTVTSARMASGLGPEIAVRPLTDRLPMRWGFVCRADLRGSVRELLVELVEEFSTRPIV